MLLGREEIPVTCERSGYSDRTWKASHVQRYHEILDEEWHGVKVNDARGVGEDLNGRKGI